MKRFFENLFFNDSSTYRLARLASIAGSVAAIIRVNDRYFPNLLPSGLVGFLLFGLIVVCGFLGIELLNAYKEIRNKTTHLSGDARSDFAASLVTYASSLSSSSPPRDQALLELRRWCSRWLHLNGCHKERAEIGQLALGAAAALRDKYAEASILVDDLGWGLHVQGRSSEGRESINEGISIINEMSEAEKNRPEVVELMIKALRHLVSIQFATDHNINTALQGVKSLAQKVTALPGPAQRLHLAQFQHTEAALIHHYLDQELGSQGHVDPTGRLSDLYHQAIECSKSAESQFGDLGDIERQLKALKMHVELLRHGNQASKLQSAESRLRRLETIASRHLN